MSKVPLRNVPFPVNQSRRRVLIIGNFLSASGKGSRGVCEDLAAHLTLAGWEVVTTSTYHGRVSRLADMLLTVWRKRHLYRVAQVDVYSGPAFFWAEAVCSLLRWIGKPFILTLHGGALPEFSKQWPSRVKRLLTSASVVTAPSRYLLEKMAPYHDELKLLPNPLDLAAYEFRLRTHPHPRLVWLRAFHHIYNPQLAPQIVAQLTTDFPDVHLIMVGPDKGDGSLQATQALAVALGIAERTAYPGGVAKQDVSLWLNRGDIFLNTTSIDNTPVSVMEAMACGLIVISTNVGGIPYLLQHDHDALLVSSDVQEIAEAVRRVLTTPGLGERLSKNARLKTEQMDWCNVLPEWEKLLLDIQ